MKATRARSRVSPDTEETYLRRLRRLVPNLSVDAVVFGFHGAELKVLLMKWKGMDVWALPGGYVTWRESVDAAVLRCLQERTGLSQILLRQFHTFGGLTRTDPRMRKLLHSIGIPAPASAWPLHRVVSVGYYALVDYWKVQPHADDLSESCGWYPAYQLPEMAFDHGDIVAHALTALREQLDAPTAGATLLPAEFTMPELQRLHEAILGHALDRRNFQKRMLDRGVLERLPKRRMGGAHRAPYLYRFAEQPTRAPF